MNLLPQKCSSSSSNPFQTCLLGAISLGVESRVTGAVLERVAARELGQNRLDVLRDRRCLPLACVGDGLGLELEDGAGVNDTVFLVLGRVALVDSPLENIDIPSVEEVSVPGVAGGYRCKEHISG